ncbi:hypothetical protein [Cellulomonas sp. Leaf334]|uniref:hypothetical protein n=1 Tax=Cellulomonas sp. Leaf334 TaxID=1736339 RepID=UPI0006F90C09|nr:hypothetical protein [Cellulomonas sp. Leaf334]KQR08537.1 hypothetical protein ASF78_20015 [Cellulomonas sp. Leaf334]
MFGLALVALGALWFLQGSGLVRIEPVACVGNCAPITGHRPGWQVAGALTAAVGLLIIGVAARWRRRPNGR